MIKTTAPIYLDYHATTPLDERVWEAMQPFFIQHFGNPHSSDHAFGWVAEEAVSNARQQVASLINAQPKEIIFTSGASEACNLAIKGAALFEKYERAHKRKHIITVATEHKCVLESCRDMQRDGFEVTILPVQPDGLLNIDDLQNAMRDDTLLVSVMAANNEIGVLQPLAEIGALCRERSVLFHTDAAQAFGKIPLDVEAMQIDLLSISGHKAYGPKGVGALYIRRKPRARILPLFSGGGQEQGLRSGTVPTPLAVGLGKAAEIAGQQMEADTQRMTRMRDAFWQQIQSLCPQAMLNGSPTRRLPGNLNICFPDVDEKALVRALSGVAVSSASACASGSPTPSYVLQALGRSEAQARSAIRFGLGRYTTQAELDAVLEKMATCFIPSAQHIKNA